MKTNMLAVNRKNDIVANSATRTRRYRKIKLATKVAIPLMALCALSFLPAGCAPQKDAIPVAERVVTDPYQEFSEASLFFYENGIKRWWLDTDYMSRPLVDTGKVLVAPVRISMFDSLGRLTSRVLADSGESDSKMDVFDLWGSVYIKSENDMIIKSERLKWFKTDRKVTSETFVQIQTKQGDILRGKGLDAIDNFARFTFKSNVRGKFPDFKRRMEQQDEDFFR